MDTTRASPTNGSNGSNGSNGGHTATNGAFPETTASSQQPIAIDLAERWRAVRRRWRLVGLVLVVVVGSVFVWTFKQPKIYSGTCSIIIDPAPPKVLHGITDVVEMGTAGYWANKEYLETQFKIITSKATAQRVIDRLGLANDPDYPYPGALAQAGGKPRNLVPVLIDQLKVAAVRESRIAQLTVEDRNPERAAQIANGLAAQYIEGNLEYKVGGTNEASAWLADQAVGLKQKLLESEQAMFEYRKKNQLLDVSLDTRQTLNTRNVQLYAEKLAELRAKKIEVESARKLMLAAQDNIDEQESLPEVRQNPVVQNLRGMHVDLSKTLAEMETTYGEKHPKVEALKRKLSSVRQDYVEEISKILKANEKAYRALEENERALLRLLDKEKGEAIDLAKLEVAFRPLAREADDNQALYKLIAQRQKETGLTGLVKTNNVRILDPAVPGSKPVKPRVALNMMIALVVGLLLGLGAALSAEVLDNTVKNQEQAESVVGAPVLGMVPLMGEKNKGNRNKSTPDEQRLRDLSVFHDTKSAAAEACRSLRSNLLFLSGDRPIKSLVVTSPGPQEGKTTTAINLAVTMAQSGQRVLLIDTDLRRPRLHRSFGLSNKAGISSAVIGQDELDAVVNKTEIPNLDVIVCGPLPPNPAEILHTNSFGELMRRCAERYDRVIYDSPPTSAVTDPVIIGNRADGVVLVIRAGHTTRRAAAYARRQLSDAKARILGTIVNSVDPTDPYYNYYYSQYYKKYYSYGYGGYSSSPSSSSSA
jgi:polysaccharide biosynthesis transport protein